MIETTVPLSANYCRVCDKLAHRLFHSVLYPLRRKVITVAQIPKRSGLLVTLVGPAGAGKNQLINDMIARFAGRTPRVRQFPTATTRPMRETEQEGREHHFVSIVRFQEMIEQGELLEWQLVHGKGADRYYGMPRETLENGLDSGDVLLADIEYLGAQRAKEAYPDNVIGVFVMPPSIGALIERMRNRATEGENEIGKRLLRVPAELEYASKCDYVILNDSFAEASSLMHSILNAEIARRGRDRILSSVLVNRFEYTVRVVPVTGQAGVFNPIAQPPHPEALLAPNTAPFDAALALARRALDPEADPERLVTAPTDHDGYTPPLHLSYTVRNDGIEQVAFIYQYHVRD